MVEATNYVYLAILICLQYLGLQHESYELTIDFTEQRGVEQQATISVHLTKTEGNDHQWMITSLDQKNKIPLTVVKDSVTDYERGTPKISEFSDINFGKLRKQRDTVFNTNNKAVIVITESENTIFFKVQDQSAYDKITMKVKE